MLKNKSPLRYPGGKSRACKKIEEIILENYDIKKIKTLYSPFLGGGSLEFHMQNKYNLEINANDKFNPLYIFWKVCKEDNNKLCSEIKKYLNKVDKEKFKEFRSKIMDEDDDIEKGNMYFIINRCSFSGATLSGGFSKESSKKRFTESSVDRVKSLDLSKFTISNLDFKEYINKIPDKSENLIFLDPPYYLEQKSKLYGKNGDMHEAFDHKGLFKCLVKKSNWILTYNNCKYITDLYKDYIILNTDWSYGMNKSKKSSEIVILSHIKA